MPHLSVYSVDTLSTCYASERERLREQGSTDMLEVLRATVASFSVNAQPIADGATVVRPPNIRNLAADHTLVMVNGKRRHRGAVIAWLVPKASEGAEQQLSIVATIAPTSTAGLALGGAALKPERSVNASAGLVFASERATATLDCFRIRVRDRLALSRDIELNRPDLGAGRIQRRVRVSQGGC